MKLFQFKDKSHSQSNSIQRLAGEADLIGTKAR